MSTVQVEVIEGGAEVAVGITEVVVDVGVTVPESMVGGSSLSLGETSTTAYRGDRGKTAYDHSQATGNPHGAAVADITGLSAALSGKAATSHTHAKSDITDLTTDLTNLATAIDGKASTSHTHAQSAITGLEADLAGKASTAYADAIDAQVQALLGDRILTVVKQADESKSSNTTQADDAELALTIPANKVARIDLSLIVLGGTTPDIAIDLSVGTATLNSSVVKGHVTGWSGATAASIVNHTEIVPGTPVVVGVGSTIPTEIQVNAVVTTTDAATVRFRWAQNSASGTTTVRKGSTMIAYL